MKIILLRSAAILHENLTARVPVGEFFEIDGTSTNLDGVRQEYAEKLRAANPQLCLLGIGENGHLAFNDPAEANFDDPEVIKVSRNARYHVPAAATRRRLV